MTPPATAAGIQDAARHLAEGRPADAVDVLERLVRDFPTYVTAHVLLAKAREAVGQHAKALEAWHAAYFLMPASPLVVRERARLLRADPISLPAEPAERLASEPESTSPVEEPEPVEESVEEASGEIEETPEPVEASAADAGEAASAPKVGSDPDAWVSDVQPSTEPESSGFSDSSASSEDDWKIVDETEAPRAEAEVPVEPTVVPPVGHRAAQPGRPAPHDVPQSGRFVDEEIEDGLETALDTPPGEDGDGATAEVDDLDALIQQLENAPRIRPDPEFKDEAPEPEIAEDELVSETLARIYEAQGQYGEAARAYEQLASKHPERATEMLSKAAAMRQKLDGAED